MSSPIFLQREFLATAVRGELAIPKGFSPGRKKPLSVLFRPELACHGGRVVSDTSRCDARRAAACCGLTLPCLSPLCSNNNPYASFGATLARDEEQNLWSTPHDVTHTEADDDRVLYNMIVVRNQLDKDSEEWQKLNYDIYTLRQTRKEVRSRWKHILEDLGFQKEADSLLSVTKLSIISDSQNMGKARDILLKLSEETNIFPTSWELSERYLFVVDRLIALDAADEFFKMASVVYPKRPSGERLDDSQKTPQCISVVIP
ncbi:PREDICTED: melanoregulin [Mesitornis unicolor]|nr:PREDICTED: melanoregulin [Mesitornis unicolor]